MPPFPMRDKSPLGYGEDMVRPLPLQEIRIASLYCVSITTHRTVLAINRLSRGKDLLIL